MKDHDVFVNVGSTDHPAKIDSMVRLSKELVDTKSLQVRWTSNNKKDVVDISSVQPMYSSEEDIQRRSMKHSKTNDQNPPSITSSYTKNSRDGQLANSYCPRRLLVRLSYECKYYINCNSFSSKQKPEKRLKNQKYTTGGSSFMGQLQIISTGEINKFIFILPGCAHIRHEGI